MKHLQNAKMLKYNHKTLNLKLAGKAFSQWMVFICLVRRLLHHLIEFSFDLMLLHLYRAK